MSKRRAAVQLTRDDLDREDSPEKDTARDQDDVDGSSTGFKPADQDILAKRVIRKARRSINNSTFGGSVSDSPFAGLLNVPNLVSPASSLLASVSNRTNTSSAAFAAFQFGTTTTSDSQALDRSDTNNSSAKPPADNSSRLTTPYDIKANPSPVASNGISGRINGAKSDEAKGQDDEDEDESDPSMDQRGPEYYQKLKRLNAGFKKWVNDYMDKSQYFDFTPCCNDYIRHISKLDDQFPVLVAISSKHIPSSSSHTVEPSVLSPILQDTTGHLPKLPESKTMSTEYKPIATTTSADNKPSFTFGGGGTMGSGLFSSGTMGNNANKITTATSSFQMPAPIAFSTPTFGSSFPTFGTAMGSKPMTQVVAVEDDEDGKYEPPQPETVTVEEKDAVYTKPGVKLFYKDAGKYESKGKGTINVKRTESGKHQLIIRAENALGTIFLNIILASAIPISVTKNHVLVVCVPNPPVVAGEKSKDTVTYLIKCATEADANELASKLGTLKS